MIDIFRNYRRFSPKSGEVAFQIAVEETDLFILVQESSEQELAALSLNVIDFITLLRDGLKNYIRTYPEFRTSLVPWEPPEPVFPEAPAGPVIKNMLQAGKVFNVGPMAAVAGALAQAVAEKFAPPKGNFLVENGGDIYIISNRERILGLLPQPEEGVLLGLRIEREEFPLAVCASSGKIGHSLSFGLADLVVVKAKNASLADAAATALANMIRNSKDLKVMLKKAEKAAKAGLILGVFAQCEEKMAVFGEMDLVILDK